MEPHAMTGSLLISRDTLAAYRFLVYVLPYSETLEPSHLQRFQSLLSVEEKSRYNHMLDWRKQREFLCSRILMRRILGTLLSLDAAQVPFHTTVYGKPYLSFLTDDSLATVTFNLSHTDNSILFAVTQYGDIGVDIEFVRDYQGKIARRFFHSDEYAWLENLALSDRAAAFYQLWTIKEACVKAIGLGLQFPLRDIPVSVGEAGRCHKHDLCWQTLHVSSQCKAAIALHQAEQQSMPLSSQIYYVDVGSLL